MTNKVVNLYRTYMDQEVVLDGTQTYHNCSFFGVTFRSESLEQAQQCLGRGNLFDTNCRFPNEPVCSSR